MDALHHANAKDRIKSPDEARLSHKDFDRFLADESEFVCVAEKDGIVVGYLRAKLQDSPDGRAHRARRSVQVNEIITDLSARRLGIGKKLLVEAFDWTAHHSAVSLELNVYAFNEEAIIFYRSLGFADLSIRLSKPISAPSVA